MTAPLFMTHHAPVGAWTSLTFGAANRGLCIDHEGSGGAEAAANADLLLAVYREENTAAGTNGAAETVAFPFVEKTAPYPGWRFLKPGEIARTLTACVDEFAAASAGLTLKVFTPHPALPNPKRSGNLQYATAPGVLLEVTIDNTQSDVPAVGFIGLACSGNPGMPGTRLRPVDWSSKTLCGVGFGSWWILAAAHVKDEVFTLQAAHVARRLAAATDGTIDPAANQGGVVIKVPPRTSKGVSLVFATYVQGLATQGIDARYLYAGYFPRVEAVANFLLHNSSRVRESCTSFDGRSAAACGGPAGNAKLAIFAQALRSYDASTQATDALFEDANAPGAVVRGQLRRGGQSNAESLPCFATIIPDGRRIALDCAVDHLPWELYRNPWVIRNVFDLATARYAYHDKVRFPLDGETPEVLREGGMTFARDFGFASAYAPGTLTAEAREGHVAGGTVTAFDGGTRPGWSGGAMAGEILLNGIYMLTSYALLADDTPWAKTRLPFARELLVSLENRDHWEPAKRTGILKAESAGAAGYEITAFAQTTPGANVPDRSLTQARGSLYLAVKTFCANLMLTTYFQNNNDLHSADYSYAFVQRTAGALVAAFDKQAQLLPANLLTPQTGPNAARLLAALEPLAVPAYLGLTSTLQEYFPALFEALKGHALTCLRPLPDGCVDPATGLLRLTSTCDTVLPGKLISILFVLEHLFQIDLSAHVPGLWDALGGTLQRNATDSAANPQCITAALFFKSPASAASAV